MPGAQIPFDLGSRIALGREDFLVGPANAAAVGWIDRWPDWPAPALILNGPAACGKKHLAAVWRERSGAVLVSCADLATQQAEYIAAQGTHIVLAGLDPWLGDANAERTLFHLYNMFKEQSRTMLITLRMPLFQADFAIADLKSRLRAAPVVVIAPPDDELLASILIKLFHDRQLVVSEDVIRYVLPRMERSFSAARDIVETADRIALAAKKPVTVALMRQVLAGLQ
jgi:chromosomal replication initiation ATPase DnaA